MELHTRAIWRGCMEGDVLYVAWNGNNACSLRRRWQRRRRRDQQQRGHRWSSQQSSRSNYTKKRKKTGQYSTSSRIKTRGSTTHAGALVELPVPVVDADAPEVAEPVAEVEAEMSVLVRVTPTDSHVSWANATALVRSSPEQLVSMHEVTEEMKAEFVQRHLLSVDEQPPRFALAMQVRAHSVFAICYASVWLCLEEERRGRTRDGLARNEGGRGEACESECGEETHLVFRCLCV